MFQNIKFLQDLKLSAHDGEIGSVNGFMVDDKTWVIGVLIAETGHWYAGKEILIPTAEIARISYEESKVYVDLALAELKATEKNEIAAVGGSNPAATTSRS